MRVLGLGSVCEVLQATYFCQLLVLAWWVQLLRSHPATWLRICWWGNIAVGLCALLHFGLLKQVLYTTLIALQSGMLVDHDRLEKVRNEGLVFRVWGRGCTRESSKYGRREAKMPLVPPPETGTSSYSRI